MTSYLLLAAAAWGVATRGGTSPRDLLVVLGLLVGATLTSRAWPRRDLTLTAALVALLGWLLIIGLVHTGPTIESVRLPLLVVVAVLTVRVARRLDLDERQWFLTGLIVVGCLQAVVALAELAVVLSRGTAVPPRADSLLGSPNGLGMLLVATSVLTAREVAHRRGFLHTAALLLQGAAILATGSRSALVVAAALLVVCAASRPGWRLRGLAAAAVIAATAVFVWRVATEPPEQRPHLWWQALGRIADRPLLGEGPLPATYDPSVAGARVTTHAHNEVLQWGVEYGLVGLGLGLLVVVLALRRSAQPPGPGDGWILVAGAALLAGGMTDFTLRITALTLVAAALVALAVTARQVSVASGDLPSPAGRPRAAVALRHWGGSGGRAMSRQSLPAGAGSALCLALLLALLLAGCRGAGDRPSEPRAAPSPSATAGAEPSAASGRQQQDPLTVSRGVPPRGLVAGLWRARNGSTLAVVAREGTDRSHYRVYDRRWRPLTPLLTVEVALAMERGLARRYVGLATRTARSGRYSYHSWVTIDARGGIREVTQQPAPGTGTIPPRPGDVSLADSRAYRPAEDAVLPVRRPPWHRPPYIWYAQPSGTVCTHPGPTRVGGTVRVSVDEGRTWRALPTTGLPSGSGPRVQSCVVAADRVVVMTGGEYPRWLHTLDRSSGELLSSHVLMTDINGYDWKLLPDGTLVADTDRPGLMVGTDPSNQVMEYRPGPVRGNDTTYVLGKDVVSVSVRRTVQVSADAGRTWREVELGLTP